MSAAAESFTPRELLQAVRELLAAAAQANRALDARAKRHKWVPAADVLDARYRLGEAVATFEGCDYLGAAEGLEVLW